MGEIILYHRFRLYALSLTPLQSVDRAHPVLERLDELSPLFEESSTLHRPSRATRPSRRVSGAAARDRWAHLDSRLVFVIDDDETTRVVTAAYLQLEGYRVRTAGNGREALGLLADEIPCALVVDLGMPVMDGAELRRRQRSLAPAVDVPFIVISGIPGGENAAAVLGATAFLAKPFDNEELKRVLEHVCV